MRTKRFCSCAIRYSKYLVKVQTDFAAVSETEVLIEIPEADSINHIVLFLTGTVAFPAGMGGAGWVVTYELERCNKFPRLLADYALF